MRTFFKPGKLESFLGTSLQETTNKLLTLSDLGHRNLRPLADRIMSSRKTDNRVWCIEQHIKQRLYGESNRKELIQYLTDAIQQGRTFRTVSDLSQFFGYSNRHLRRIFLDQIGVTPKSFLKIFRFKQILEALETKAFHSLTGLAYEFGYSDQAHFCREFSSFMGLSPRKYLMEIDPAFSRANKIDFQGWVGEMKE